MSDIPFGLQASCSALAVEARQAILSGRLSATISGTTSGSPSLKCRPGGGMWELSPQKVKQLIFVPKAIILLLGPKLYHIESSELKCALM